MPGRSYSSNDYRFGFNGKENDSESGTQDYGMRIYNPGLGRFLSVDPITKDYPFYTPYQFAGNKPINCIDLDGLEDVIIIQEIYDISGQPHTITQTVVLPKTGPAGPGSLTLCLYKGNIMSFHDDKAMYLWQPAEQSVVARQNRKTNFNPLAPAVYLFKLIGNLLVEIDNSLVRGNGVNWTSENGQSGISVHLRKGSHEVKTESIDLLIAALGGFETQGGPGFKNKYLEATSEYIFKLEDAKEQLFTIAEEAAKEVKNKVPTESELSPDTTITIRRDNVPVGRGTTTIREYNREVKKSDLKNYKKNTDENSYSPK